MISFNRAVKKFQSVGAATSRPHRTDTERYGEWYAPTVPPVGAAISRPKPHATELYVEW